MTAKEAYRIWAPVGKKWTQWVRPVPFVGIGEYTKAYNVSNLPLPKVEFTNKFQDNILRQLFRLDTEDFSLEDSGIIVDMSGEKSVRYGISLAKLGFRPIPIYNGTLEPDKARATVDNQSVGMALELWAYELRNIDLDNNARPAFLLDSNRLSRYKMDTTMYDNSWDIYPQDLPSPQCFADNSIKNIVVIGGKTLSRDVRKILAAHQKKGLRIYHTNGDNWPKRKIIFQMPKWD